MEWFIGIVVAAVLYFVWQGFRTRCPACGEMALHPKNSARESANQEAYALMKDSGLLKSLDDAGSALGSEMSKPGYINAEFRCKACGHQFSRSTAIEWLTIRNKLGEDRALAEYKKIL